MTAGVPSAGGQAALVCENLAVWRGGSAVVRSASIELKRCEAIIITGTNGSGKSTLALALAGALKVTVGRVLVDGFNVTSFSPRERRRRGLALIPQGRRVFPSLSVYENIVVLGDGLPGRPVSPERMLARQAWNGVNLASAAGNLSVGQQSAVACLSVLQFDPVVVILDEPAAGVGPKDLVSLVEAVRAYRERGGAVVIFEHRESFMAQIPAERLRLVDGNLHRG